MDVPDLKLVSDKGAGRVFVVVCDDPTYLPLVDAIGMAIALNARAIVLQASAVNGDSWRVLSEKFQQMLVGLKLRQASFVGVAAGAALVQDLALTNPKLVRTLVIIDASLRPHPSRFERVLDTLEAKLPFGLPLRLGSKNFNVRAFAHRLRCPMLLVSTQRASRFVSRELHSLGEVAPTAWYVQIMGERLDAQAHELAAHVLAFQDTPAKCPQKNLQEAV
ncbi:MAG: alpha/beta fold hydrolase [Pseudomonadota bacterium]|jgi:pimeloyl-ACP methyl ester carboxylesterase